MELDVIYKRVVGLDVHQPQITAGALIEKSDGSMRTEQRQFGAFKKDRRALAHWVTQLQRAFIILCQPKTLTRFSC
ncbi:hypothetical protein SAMN05421690_11151 [Nitrosomonas sp. Nm51]|nr:hypothetical protein SAMN05421690_11151 [Nitrosomonas sp. Nm51]